MTKHRNNTAQIFKRLFAQFKDMIMEQNGGN